MKDPRVRMFFGAFGTGAAAFNSYQCGLANYKQGVAVWFAVYVFWVCFFAWGFHDWLLAKFRKKRYS
jgi:hypothetical protein